MPFACVPKILLGFGLARYRSHQIPRLQAPHDKALGQSRRESTLQPDRICNARGATICRVRPPVRATTSNAGWTGSLPGDR